MRDKWTKHKLHASLLTWEVMILRCVSSKELNASVSLLPQRSWVELPRLHFCVLQPVIKRVGHVFQKWHHSLKSKSNGQVSWLESHTQGLEIPFAIVAQTSQVLLELQRHLHNASDWLDPRTAELFRHHGFVHDPHSRLVALWGWLRVPPDLWTQMAGSLKEIGGFFIDVPSQEDHLCFFRVPHLWKHKRRCKGSVSNWEWLRGLTFSESTSKIAWSHDSFESHASFE